MWCLISVLLSRQGLQTVWTVLQHNTKALLQRVQDFLLYLRGSPRTQNIITTLWPSSTYLSCHCVKHLEVFLRADPSCWKVFLWNKTLLTSLFAPSNAKSPAPTWLLYHWDAAESILSPLAPAHLIMTLVKTLDPDCVSRWSKEAELTHLG